MNVTTIVADSVSTEIGYIVLYGWTLLSSMAVGCAKSERDGERGVGRCNIQPRFYMAIGRCWSPAEACRRPILRTIATRQGKPLFLAEWQWTGPSNDERKKGAVESLCPCLADRERNFLIHDVAWVSRRRLAADAFCDEASSSFENN